MLPFSSFLGPIAEVGSEKESLARPLAAASF